MVLFVVMDFDVFRGDQFYLCLGLGFVCCYTSKYNVPLEAEFRL